MAVRFFVVDVRRRVSSTEISGAKNRGMLEASGGKWILGGYIKIKKDRLRDFGVINRLLTGY